MIATILSTLREPPVVGRYYMVPTVSQYPYLGYVSDWPVLGALHTDREHFHFEHEHYHVDARFITAHQRYVIGNNCIRGESVEASINRFPLFYRGTPHQKGRPELRRRKCTRATYGFAHGAEAAVRGMQEAFGDAPAPIRKADGRLLCPHRKVDLSQFPADGDGFVVCPLHGLRVCVRPQLEAAA